MSKPADGGLKAINLLASVLLACAVILMSLQVFLRFVIGQPQPWVEEINRYCFVWATYLGAVIAMVRGTHIRVTDLVDHLGPTWRGRSDLFNRLASLGVFAFVAWFGFVNVWTWRDQTFFTLPWIPQAVFSLSAPVGATLMCLYLLRRPPPDPESPPPSI